MPLVMAQAPLQPRLRLHLLRLRRLRRALPSPRDLLRPPLEGPQLFLLRHRRKDPRRPPLLPDLLPLPRVLLPNGFTARPWCAAWPRSTVLTWLLLPGPAPADASASNISRLTLPRAEPHSRPQDLRSRLDLPSWNLRRPHRLSSAPSRRLHHRRPQEAKRM